MKYKSARVPTSHDRRSLVRRWAMMSTFLLVGCSTSITPVSYPAPPSIPQLDPVQVPRRPEISQSSVAEVMPAALQQDVVEARPIPDMAGKGLTLTGQPAAYRVTVIDPSSTTVDGGSSATASGSTAETGGSSTTAGTRSAEAEEVSAQDTSVPTTMDLFADRLRMTLLKAGYNRFLDEGALRPLKARQEAGNTSLRLVVEGSLDQVALVSKVPRLDYILVLKDLNLAKSKLQLVLPLRADPEQVTRYLQALQKATTQRNGQLSALRQIHSEYSDSFQQASAAAKEQMEQLKEGSAQRKELEVAYREALTQFERTTTRLSEERQRITVSLPSLTEETEKLSRKGVNMEAEVFSCDGRFLLLDAATGETLAALRVRNRHATAQGALAGTLDALVRRLLANSPTLRAPATGDVTTPAASAGPPRSGTRASLAMARVPTSDQTATAQRRVR